MSRTGRTNRTNRAYPYVAIDPAIEARLFITVAEARLYLRLAPDPDPADAEVTDYIRQAQAIVERLTGLTFFTTKFRTFRDCFPYDLRTFRGYSSAESETEIKLRKAPLIGIDEVSFLRSGEFDVFDSAKYKTVQAGMNYYGAMVLKQDYSWPIYIDQEREAVKIDFSVGFGADAAALPYDLVAGTKRVLADLYENKGDCDPSYMLSASARQFLNRFIIMSI